MFGSVLEMNLFSKLWNDDAGIVALEYLLVSTIVGLSLVVGLGAVAFGVNSELTELAQALSAINQSFGCSGASVGTQFGSSTAGVGGSAAGWGAYWHGFSTTDVAQAQGGSGLALGGTPVAYTLTVDQVP
jgi:Flp pilus assembly pilin Flp